jgi:uncharacterized protein (DUF697 family)
MNTPIFNINKEQIKKAGVKFLLVLIGGVATYLQTDFIPFLESVTSNPIALTILMALNTALVDAIRKFISDEEGNLNIGRARIKIA